MVRNFWITTAIDGRSTVSGGPRTKDGGFVTTIFVRAVGEIAARPVYIIGRIDPRTGELTVTATPADGSPSIELSRTTP